jgi:hypothetical protein
MLENKLVSAGPRAFCEVLEFIAKMLARAFGPH